MKTEWSNTLLKNVSEILLEAGYHYFTDPNTHKGSYVQRIGRLYYPRFHVYIKDGKVGTVIDLHIDQKQASYEGSNMHSGEYDGKVVEDEMARLVRWLEHYTVS